MLKRYLLASLVTGLALGAQSAMATDLWYYEGHGWLPQPPFSSMDAPDSRPGTVIAGPTSAIASSSQVAKSKIVAPAPYNRTGFDAGNLD